MKKLIAFGVIILAALLIAYYPHVMINPGELVNGHQDLNNKCRSCHKPFWGIDAQKCIGCHKPAEIDKVAATGTDSTIKKNRIPFHQILKNQNCTACHTDHKGVHPDISLSKFDHELLSGSEKTNCNNCHAKPTDKIHTQISGSCNSCHNTTAWRSGAGFNHDMIRGTDKNNCVSCHPIPANSIHKQVSSQCSNCHNTKGWKAGTTFNHDMIQGADKTNCISCHPMPEASYHRSFKDNCTKCHTTSRWKPSTFDHSKYFTLDGHHNAECNTCHSGNNYSSYTCYGCHEHSQGEIVKEHSEHGMSNINNCVSCHKNGSEHEGGEHGRSEHEGRGGGDDD